MSTDPSEAIIQATQRVEARTARSSQARLIQLHTWSARTIELAIGGRETTFHMCVLDGSTRQLVPTYLGSVEDACEHMACEAIRAAVMTAGYAEVSGRLLNHAKAILREFHELMNGAG